MKSPLPSPGPPGAGKTFAGDSVLPCRWLTPLGPVQGSWRCIL